MLTPNQKLRQIHLEAQEAVAALWDLLLFCDSRMTKPYVIQLRQKREARILQSYCFATVPEATLFLSGLLAQAKGKPLPEGLDKLELTECPRGYVFKEVDPPKRTRKSPKTRSDCSPESLQGENDAPLEVVKPKRKRRTQAEIAADSQAKKISI